MEVREYSEDCDGGEGGIRTPGRVSPTPVFKTGAINHSATSPYIQFTASAATGVSEQVSVALGNVRPSRTDAERFRVGVVCMCRERGVQ